MSPVQQPVPETMQVWRQSARGVAVVAALFCVVLCTLVLANYVQLKLADPLNNPALLQLMQRTAAAPDDQTLKEEVRALDLLARKAYFTKQSAARLGGYLLLGSAVVLIAALKVLAVLRPPAGLLTVAGSRLDDPWLAAVLARKWLAVSGLLLVALCLVIALTYHPSFTGEEQAGPGTSPPPAPGIVASVPGPAEVAAPVMPPAAVAGAADFASAAEMAANWPAFRGPGGSATAAPGKYPLDWDAKSGRGILWKSEVPRAGNNSPIVWEKRLFVAGADKGTREVFCYDTDSGQLLWRREVKGIPGSPAEPPEVGEDTGFAAPTLATDGRRVFAIFANGDLACFTLAGEAVWSRNLGVPKNQYGYASSLITFEDTLFIQYDQTGGARLLALKSATGETRWEKAREVGSSWASPIVANTGTRTEVILNASPSVISYDARSGAELWNSACMSGEVASSPAYADGLAYVANQYARLAAIRTADGTVAWKTEDAELPDVASPLATPKYLFLATGNGTVTCFEAKTGNVLWKHEFDKAFYASPVLAGENLYLVDTGGTVQIIKAAGEFAAVGSATLNERVMCTPALAGGRIYIRGEKHLFCIGAR